LLLIYLIRRNDLDEVKTMENTEEFEDVYEDVVIENSMFIPSTVSILS